MEEIENIGDKNEDIFEGDKNVKIILYLFIQ